VKLGKVIAIICFILVSVFNVEAQSSSPILSGKIITKDKENVEFATVKLKNTEYGCTSNEQGMYFLHAPAGKYTLVVSAVGYETVEKDVNLTGERLKMNITLKDAQVALDEVVVVATGVGRVKKSPFNTIAVDTKQMQNSTKNLSDA
jgi:hypothetical protein